MAASETAAAEMKVDGKGPMGGTWTREEWNAMTWRDRSSILRSAFQKLTGRRAEPELAMQVAMLLIEDGRGLSFRNVLLFVIEDMCVSAPVLLPKLVERVKAIIKSGVKASDLTQHPEVSREILRLVRWVADPRWKRCRDVALLANYNLCLIERNIEPPKAVDSLFSKLMALDRIWIKEERAWMNKVKEQLEGYWLEAFKLVPNRLFVFGYHLWKAGYLPSNAPSVEIPELSAVPEYVPPGVIPVFPQYVFDKHTAKGRSSGCDMKHFFEVAGAVVNEAKLEHHLVAPLVAQGLAFYFDMEKEFGTKGARSSALRVRVREGKMTKRKALSSSNEANQHQSKKPRGRSAETIAEKIPPRSLAKKSTDQGNDFQHRMRQKLEPMMPKELQGLAWLQPITSGVKRPVIRKDSLVYKGPFDSSWPYRDRVARRYGALRRLGAGHVPKAEWREIEGYWWWVSEYCDDLEIVFEASKPLDAIPDDPTFLSELVASGVAKLTQEMGDLCCRNMPWSPKLQTFVILDLEDANKNLPDLKSCQWVEFCYSPLRRMRKEKRSYLEALMRKHVSAIVCRLKKMKQKAQGSEVEVIEEVLQRLQNESV